VRRIFQQRRAVSFLARQLLRRHLERLADRAWLVVGLEIEWYLLRVAQIS
jgi:glutamine synthetase